MKSVECDEVFIEEFETRVKNTIQEHDLINKKDRVLVACSGGKDSTVVLYLLNKFGYDAQGLIIDLLMGSWSEQNLRNLKNFCDEHDLKLNITSGFHICDIKSTIQKKYKIRPCSICGVIKRWILNKKAREMGFTKLATGHNLDDEAQTVIMNLIGGNVQSFVRGPKVDSSTSDKFVIRVKPLYFCSEKDIKKYTQLKGFNVLYDRCPCARGGPRWAVRDMLNDLETKNENVKDNIVKNHLRHIPGLKKLINPHGVKECQVCGEPCKKDVCKFCKFMKMFSEMDMEACPVC